MIWYHQAYDLNHTLFRTLSLLEYQDGKRIKVQKLKILNFYLLFPSQITKMTFPRPLMKYRKFFKGIEDKYNKVSNPKITFSKINSLQDTAFGSLASSGLIDKDSFMGGYMTRTSKQISPELLEELKSFHHDKENLFKFLISGLASLPLTGKQGLKERTNLIDHRYDPS